MAQRARAMRTKQDESKKYFCPYCERNLVSANYYLSTDPMIKTGLCTMCKDCAKKIAYQYNEATGEYGSATVDSIKAALERLDKPWIKNLYERALSTTNRKRADDIRSTLWDEYIRTLQIPAYKDMRWRDGEFLEELQVKRQQEVVTETDHKKQLEEEYIKNRNDVIRLIGYDPFEKESELDKPMLYA